MATHFISNLQPEIYIQYKFLNDYFTYNYYKCCCMTINEKCAYENNSIIFEEVCEYIELNGGYMADAIKAKFVEKISNYDKNWQVLKTFILAA